MSDRKPNSTDLRILASAAERALRQGNVLLYPRNGEYAAYERLRKMGLMMRNPSKKLSEYQITREGEALIIHFIELMPTICDMGGVDRIQYPSGNVAYVIPMAKDSSGRQLYCSVCVDAGHALGECAQMSTPSGHVCINGHGGADGVIADDLPAEVRTQGARTDIVTDVKPRICPVCNGSRIVAGPGEYTTETCSACNEYGEI